MMGKFETIKEKEDELGSRIERYLFHHPYIGCFLSIVGVPILCLLTMAVCTAVIMIPISFFMGWL
ncbi:MAG: hypothetical protein J6B50_13270 [Lachnospiraceae bacterium]|nr:hypothetical protein [Lachnospiraceae bacterium]